MDVKQLQSNFSSASEEDSLGVFYLQVPCSTSSDESEMSSQPVGMPSEPRTTGIEDKTAAERRENNRIAQQRYRRRQRNELSLLRHKSVKYFQGEMEMYDQLLRVSHEKNMVLAEAEAQERTIEDMECRLRNCNQEYSELQVKFDALISAHIDLLQRTNAMAHVSANQAPQSAKQCGQEASRLA